MSDCNDTDPVEALLALIDAEPDEEGDCLRCDGRMAVDEGSDPTPLCHRCAQAVLAELSTALRARTPANPPNSSDGSPAGEVVGVDGCGSHPTRRAGGGPAGAGDADRQRTRPQP